MAEITLEEVEHVAKLAQLSLDDATKQRLAKEMGEILTYIDQLNALDTSGVEPMMHVLDMANVYREDAVGESLTQEQALANAPSHDNEYFLVPRILDADAE